MATQNYLLNQPFNTLSIDELKDQDGTAAWTWEGRTLVGYVSADNYDNIIPVGSEFVHNEQTGNLQGVWELNKLQLSVFIENAGPDSYVKVSAATHELFSDLYLDNHNKNSRPLTDESLLCVLTANNGDVINFWYASGLSCRLYTGNNRTLSCYSWDTDPSTDNINIQYSNTVNLLTSGTGLGVNPGVTTNKTLSVVLVEGGVMTYSNNKFTLNPNHPSL